MFINKEDYDLLCDIEIYLAKRNKKLFTKIWNLNEKLRVQYDKSKKASYGRIKAKRQLDKNYARGINKMEV